MLLDQLADHDVPVYSVGKIFDVFLGRGIGDHVKSKNNAEGMAETAQALNEVERGLIFTNLVDFDMLFGHRNNVEGYGHAIEEFDRWLPSFLERLLLGDLLLITADHGCDPTTPSTDHSREYVPVLAYGARSKAGVDLGLRTSLSDLGQTVAENFGVTISKGTSFLPLIA
jgi:phosphopentomutase